MPDKRSEMPPTPSRTNAGRGPTGPLSGGISRVAEFVVPSLVRAVDVEEVVERIDLDRAVASLDVNAVLQRVDLDAVLERVDLDALLQRVDVNAIADRVDLDAVVARLDVNAVVARIDIEAVLQRIDVHDLAVQARIGDLVAQTTEEVATGTLDLLRRQCAGLDLLISRVGARLARRDPDALPPTPPKLEEAAEAEAQAPGAAGHKPTPGAVRRAITGHYAGAVTRLAGFLVDSILYFGIFSAFTALVRYIAGLFVDVPASWGRGSPLWAIGLVLWAFLYSFATLDVAGRTPGMHLAGLRVLSRDGSPLTARQAFLHVIAFPLNFLLLGLGFLGIIFGGERRALHNVISGTVIVYDWGSRLAELPTPMSQWLARQEAHLPTR
jgi:uncharacterized RDD family membrane protein YckC